MSENYQHKYSENRSLKYIVVIAMIFIGFSSAVSEETDSILVPEDGIAVQENQETQDIAEAEWDEALEVIQKTEKTEQPAESEKIQEIQEVQKVQKVEAVKTAEKAEVPEKIEAAEAAEIQIPQIPAQFVILRTEGNCQADALSWILNAVNSRQNPDSSNVKMTFFVNGLNLQMSRNSRKVLRKAYRKGHEIGNNTFSGFVDTTGANLDARLLGAAVWREEIEKNDSLIRKHLRIPKRKVVGFLAPRLEYNEHTFRVLKENRFLYDASIQEADFVAPFNLGEGSKTDSLWAIQKRNSGFKTAGKQEGLWILPTLQWVVPHDSLSEVLGFEKGLRKRSFAADKTFDTLSGKITGVDSRIFATVLFGGLEMRSNEAAATIKHSFNLAKEAGVPFPFPLTSIYYASRSHIAGSYRDRRRVIEGVIDYMLSFENVRFVSGKEAVKFAKEKAGIAVEEEDESIAGDEAEIAAEEIAEVAEKAKETEKTPEIKAEVEAEEAVKEENTEAQEEAVNE